MLNQFELQLFNAAQSNNTSLADEALKLGADVNAQNDYGETPLHKAATAGAFEVAELLLVTHKAEVTRCDSDGYTPLHVIGSDMARIAKLFIDNGADINQPCKYGLTPLEGQRGVLKEAMRTNTSEAWELAFTEEAAQQLKKSHPTAISMKNEETDTSLDSEWTHYGPKIISMPSELTPIPIGRLSSDRDEKLRSAAYNRKRVAPDGSLLENFESSRNAINLPVASSIDTKSVHLGPRFSNQA